MIYKLLTAEEWAGADAKGRFDGSAVDERDGYIHLSGHDQVVETAAKHLAGQTGLVLLTVDPDRLGAALRWEASRGGAPFPHLYGPLPVAAVIEAQVIRGDAAVAIAALLG